MLDRAFYFGRMALTNFSQGRFQCPNCGSSTSSVESRKMVVTTLQRCRKCMLMFRAPTDSREFSNRFYNRFYQQGFTTEMPSDTPLEQMKASAFKNTPKNFDHYISVLELLGVPAGARLFDFGCSWGYGSWQMMQAGYDVWASEAGQNRARYAAEKLGVRVVGDIAAFTQDATKQGSFDCFFTCHVIEHVPAPREVFEIAARLLRPGGIFLSFTPNGSKEHRVASPDWDRMWGAVHPNFIDDRFLLASFPSTPLVLTSRDHGAFLPELQIPQSGTRRLDLARYELVFAARLAQEA